MAKFKKIPVTVEAITFEELVAHGRASGARELDGMLLNFDYQGHEIAPATPDAFLVMTLEGTQRFNRGDMLITGTMGEIYPCAAAVFNDIYEPVEATK